MRRIAFGLALALSLTTAAPGFAQTEISWSTNASRFRNVAGDTIILICPPDGSTASLWGTGTYTADSSICTAAVHAGLITMAQGGTFLLRSRPGRDSYSGSRRNGVTSQDWGEYDASFTVERFVPPAPPPPPALPPPIPVIDWERNASDLAPNGRRFTFVCRANGTPSVLRGVDLYSWDSSICTAAAHAGVITPAHGGTVTIEMRPGLRGYAGSVRNGITSMNGAGTVLGFVLVR